MNPNCSNIDCSKAKINNYDNEHVYNFRHFCKFQTKCSHLNDFEHIKLFYHENFPNTTQSSSSQIFNVSSVQKKFVLMNEKKKCPDFEKCKLLSDSQHKESYYHPCKIGKDCKTISDEVHINRFIHPCPKGKDCKDENDLHKLQFLHQPSELQICTNPKSCKDKTKTHALKYRHFCNEKNCSKSFDEEHKFYFIHSCKYGDKCKNQEKEEHIQNFTHPCKYNENCRYLLSNDIKHMLKFTHNVKSSSSSLIDWPSNWASPLPPKISSFISKGNYFNIVQLSTTSTEYQTSASLFQTHVKQNIISIERIENYSLWISYYNKHHILQKYGKEMNLFHGTSTDIIPTIAKNGFDFRISNLGGKYGGGTYFSPNSSFSNGYTHCDPNTGVKKMFIVRVSLGDSVVEQTLTQGIRKPKVNQSKNRDYDTIISSNNMEYIVFDNAQSYPEYIITYK
jgi:hypothetical protein